MNGEEKKKKEKSDEKIERRTGWKGTTERWRS